MSNISAWLRRHQHANWVLLDQVLVSGCNFIAGILLARALGPESFGVFVLLYGVLLYANTFQGALIISPMLSNAPQLAGLERCAYLGSALTLQIALTIMLATIAVAAGTFYAHWAGAPAIAHLFLPVALVIVAFQLQDWLRRYYFIAERGKAVFLNDVVSYGGQVAMLAFLAARHRLDVDASLWTIAGCSALAFLVGWNAERIRPTWRAAGRMLREGWRTGRDYLTAWQFQWVGTQGVLLVGAGYIGAHTVGGIRAAQNIVGPINILYQAMENVVPVHAARTYSTHGRAGLVSYLRRVTAWGTLLLVPVLLVLVYFASDLVQLVYGAQYREYSSLIAWQAGYIFLSFFYRQASFYHRSVKRTRVVAWSGVILAVSALTIAVLAVDSYAQSGIMFALIAGQVLGLTYLLYVAMREGKAAE